MSNNELGHPKSSYFTFESSNNKFKAGPIWDLDYSSTVKSSKCTTKNTIYYNALFKSPTFVSRVKEIWNQYYNNIQLDSEINSLRNDVYVAANFDAQLWGLNHNHKDIVFSDYDKHIELVREVLGNKLNVVNSAIQEL